MATHNDDKTQPKSEKESWIVYLAFSNFAVSVYFVFIVVLVGAQDILSGTRIQTSWVLLADILPYFVAPLTVPFFVSSIPYGYRIVTCFLMILTAFLCLGLVESLIIKLISVALASFGAGILDTSSIGMTSYFSSSVLSWYSTASGAGLLMAPLYYTAMTTWFCVSPRITLLVLGPGSASLLLSYYFIHKKIYDKPQTTKEVSYTRLTTSDDDDITAKHKATTEHKKSPYKLNSGEDKEEISCLDDEKSKVLNRDGLTFSEKLAATKKLLLIVGLPVTIAFASEYLFFQSVITTIAYQNAPFQPRDHYQYYSLSLMIGEVLGRSNRSFLEFFKPDWLFTPTRLLIWVLSILELLHLILFILESWYRFFPGVEIPIVLCFTAGVIIGLEYSNSLEILRVSFSEREREFAMTMAILPIVSGPIISALLGLYVEPRLLEHCSNMTGNVEYCITRSSNLKKAMQVCKGKLLG